jgi:hypothetical protein
VELFDLGVLGRRGGNHPRVMLITNWPKKWG